MKSGGGWKICSSESCFTVLTNGTVLELAGPFLLWYRSRTIKSFRKQPPPNGTKTPVNLDFQVITAKTTDLQWNPLEHIKGMEYSEVRARLLYKVHEFMFLLSSSLIVKGDWKFMSLTVSSPRLFSTLPATISFQLSWHSTTSTVSLTWILFIENLSCLELYHHPASPIAMLWCKNRAVSGAPLGAQMI